MVGVGLAASHHRAKWQPTRHPRLRRTPQGKTKIYVGRKHTKSFSFSANTLSIIWWTWPSSSVFHPSFFSLSLFFLPSSLDGWIHIETRKKAKPKKKNNSHSKRPSWEWKVGRKRLVASCRVVEENQLLLPPTCADSQLPFSVGSSTAGPLFPSTGENVKKVSFSFLSLHHHRHKENDRLDEWRGRKNNFFDSLLHSPSDSKGENCRTRETATQKK